MNIESHLKNSGEYSDHDLALAKYGYSVLRNELSKFAIMFIFYLALGYLSNFFFYMLILVPVRIFSGGLHMKSNIACFIISSLICFLAIYILPMIILPYPIYIGLLIFSIGITVWISPLKNPHRPVKTRIRYMSLKKKASLFIIVDSMLLIIISSYSYEQYFYIGVWALFINAIQLFIIRIVDIRKGGKHGNFKSIKE